MESESPVAAAMQVLQAFNEHEPASLADVLADDFVEHSAPAGMPPTKETVSSFVGVLTTALPDFHFATDLVVDGGGDVVVYGTASGTMQQSLFGCAPTGRSGSWPEVHIFRVVDGRVREHWDVIDRLTMFASLGLSA